MLPLVMEGDQSFDEGEEEEDEEEEEDVPASKKRPATSPMAKNQVGSPLPWRPAAADD